MPWKVTAPPDDNLYQCIMFGGGIPPLALHIKLVSTPSCTFDGPFIDTVAGTIKNC